MLSDCSSHTAPAVQTSQITLYNCLKITECNLDKRCFFTKESHHGIQTICRNLQERPLPGTLPCAPRTESSRYCLHTQQAKSRLLVWFLKSGTHAGLHFIPGMVSMVYPVVFHHILTFIDP